MALLWYSWPNAMGDTREGGLPVRRSDTPRPPVRKVRPHQPQDANVAHPEESPYAEPSPDG